MGRPVADDYFQEYSHDGVVYHFEHSKYEEDLEKYADELEKELALAKAEPFTDKKKEYCSDCVHSNKFWKDEKIFELEQQIKVLEKALDRTTDYISNLVPCYRCNLFEQCQYGYKFEQCANTWKQWALSKAEEELKGETE